MPEEYRKLFANYLILKSGLTDKHFRVDPLNFSILCENKNTIIISEVEVVRMAFAALSPWFPQLDCHKQRPLEKALLDAVV